MPTFMPPSVKALTTADNSVKSFKYKDEFEGCPIGMSFQVLTSDMSLSTLRPLASRQGKLLKRKFRVIDHSEMDPSCFEVYRLPDPVENKEKQPKAILPALRGFQPISDNPGPVGDGSTAPVGWPLPDKTEGN